MRVRSPAFPEGHSRGLEGGGPPSPDFVKAGKDGSAGGFAPPGAGQAFILLSSAAEAVRPSMSAVNGNFLHFLFL